MVHMAQLEIVGGQTPAWSHPKTVKNQTKPKKKNKNICLGSVQFSKIGTSDHENSPALRLNYVPIIIIIIIITNYYYLSISSLTCKK